MATVVCMDEVAGVLPFFVEYVWGYRPRQDKE